MSMYGHDPYYFSMLRTYVVYFGRLFNDIRITRNDPDGDQDTLVRVPLSYSGRDKNLLRVDVKDGSPEMENCPPGFLVFPHMGYELTGISYDPDRTTGIHSQNVRKNNSDLDKLKQQYEPAPYNLTFALYVMSKNIEDGNKIIEQILPFFKPHFTSSVILIPEMDITRDIPVNLDSVDFEDRFRGDLTERRNVFWTLNFTMYGYFYGPIINKPIIKVANTNFYVGNTATAGDPPPLAYQVKPGMDANGAATSNADLSVAYSNIAVDDTYGYLEIWSDETDA